MAIESFRSEEVAATEYNNGRLVQVDFAIQFHFQKIHASVVLARTLLTVKLGTFFATQARALMSARKLVGAAEVARQAIAGRTAGHVTVPTMLTGPSALLHAWRTCFMAFQVTSGMCTSNLRPVSNMSRMRALRLARHRMLQMSRERHLRSSVCIGEFKIGTINLPRMMRDMAHILCRCDSVSHMNDCKCRMVDHRSLCKKRVSLRVCPRRLLGCTCRKIQGTYVRIRGLRCRATGT